MNILWLLTARGGSKGVPRKNLRRIGNDSLIEWKCAGARAAGASLADCVASSDSEEILCEAMRSGFETVIYRPAELSTDTATSASVVKHALESLFMVKQDYTHVMLLEPSSPFTRVSQYAQAIAMAATRQCDAVIGMRATEPSTQYIDVIRDDGGINALAASIHGMKDQRRQARVHEWTPSSSLYLFRVDMFLRTGDIYGGGCNYGLLCDRWSSVEIDSLDDLALAEFAYEKGYVSKAEAVASPP